jgi:hypothetical protein
MKSDNQIIAEFMGGKRKSEALPKTSEHMSADEWWLPHHGIMSPTYFKYSTSWDWLMPVFPELRKAGFLGKVQVTVYGDPDLKATYDHVVELIKYFNTQK